MAHVKIFGLRSHLSGRERALSDAIHAAGQEVLGLPPEKRFHRFLKLDAPDFIFPDDRSKQYTIIEISLFSGRNPATKKFYIKEIIRRLHEDLGLALNDIEVLLREEPRSNFGLRGTTGDELTYDYPIEL